jgi:dTDP-4-amino-4,6-dideoxygalactose transaminase
MSSQAVDDAVEVLRSGYIGQGPRVEQFEYELSKFLNTDYVITTNSATSAESLIYHMLKKPSQIKFIDHFEPGDKAIEIDWPGLSVGDEVLATPLTCTATNWPIVSNNLSLKWVDTCPDSLGPDLDDLKRKLSPKTKLISIVHWGGYPVDLRKLREIQYDCHRKYGFFPLIIEDCAHALGSRFESKILGSHGNFSTFSFQAIKHVTSVDGGLLVVPDQNMFKRAKLLRWHGIDRESNRKDFRCEADIPEIGFKYHMNDVSAAIGLANLKHYDEISEGFRRCSDFYRSNLANIDGLEILQLPTSDRDVTPWLFSVNVKRKVDFYRHMNDSGIVVSQVHERNDKHSAVKMFGSFLPSLDKICAGLICIPCGWWVSDDDLNYICNTIKEGW